MRTDFVYVQRHDWAIDGASTMEDTRLDMSVWHVPSLDRKMSPFIENEYVFEFSRYYIYIVQIFLLVASEISS